MSVTRCRTLDDFSHVCILKSQLKKYSVQRSIICLCISIFVSIYAECFYEAIRVTKGEPSFGFLASDFLGWQTGRAFFVFLLSLAVLFLCRRFGKKLLFFLDRYRYLLAVIILFVCVSFELSGSSIAVWAQHLGGNTETGALFGISREIRADEWRVSTPFAFSQAFNDYASSSDIIRGTSTDLSLIYAQPSWDVSTIFRPFLWGYLLLGSAKGLSFFWCARLLAMVLFSYEGAKVLFSNSKSLAAVFALICVFSPISQWWFAVNGTAELFIFGFGVMLSTYGVFRYSTLRRKCLCSVALAWCAGGYIMILYPAWQVPLFYVFAFFTFIAVRKAIKQNMGDKEKKPIALSVLLCLMAMIVMIVFVGISLLSSIDVYKVITNTVYPGNRLDIGGGCVPVFLSASISIFTSLDAGSFFPNACESAGVFSLAPIGVALSVVALFYSRNANWVIIAGLLLEVFIAWYSFFGLPEPLAQLTLFSRTTAARSLFALGILDAFLLLYSLTQIRDAFVKLKNAQLPFVVVFSLSLFGLAAVVFPFFGAQQYRLLWCVMLLLIVLSVVLSSVWYMHNGTSSMLLLSFAFVLVLSGLTVNPVQKGADVLLENEVTSSIRGIVEEDQDAIWIADNSTLGQACITAGARTINCVNVYPNLDLWENLFPDGKEYEIYNRYAHIGITVSQESSSLKLIHPDAFNASLNAEALKKTGAKYFISYMDLGVESSDEIQFIKLSEANDKVAIYQINYK